MENKQEQLQMAIHIASVAHMEQFDKSGKAYILHPLHLMSQLLYDPELAAIAVMHDVVEDSDYTIDYLQELGFSTRVLAALQLLTHVKGVDYRDYIECICTNLDAITVKRKDLEHNSCITRLKGLTEKDHKRMEKYNRAFVRLGEARDTICAHSSTG